MDALLGVVGAEHVTAAHQHIYPGLGQKGGRFAVHATVHLDEGFRTALGDELECVAVEMAAQDYGALGGEGISSRSLSGISEHYRPDYSEKIKAVLRRARKPGVIS